MPLFDSESTSPPPAAQQQKLAGEHGNPPSAHSSEPTADSSTKKMVLFQANDYSKTSDKQFLFSPLAADAVRADELKEANNQLTAARYFYRSNRHIR